MNIEARLTGYCGEFTWSAIDDADTYDGTEDNGNRHMIGYGATMQEAIDDLKRLMQEKWECDHPEECEDVNPHI